jgi:ABC-type nitrate/sulfonate/bicarbonate transport system permease component
MQRGLRLFGIIPLLVLLAVWEVLARSGVYSAALLPTPLEVGRVLISDAGDLLKHTQASLARVTLGVALAFFTAVPLGLMIGRFKILDLITDWSIQIFRSFPIIALIPLAILFFGIGDRPAIILIWLAAFWPLLISTIFGVKNVERTLLKVAKVANASDLLILRDILWPSALPSILTGLRLALGAGWLTVVTAEMMAVKSGLGYLIMYAQIIFRPDLIIAGILIIGTIGLLFDQMVRLVRTALCGWQEGLVLES